MEESHYRLLRLLDSSPRLTQRELAREMDVSLRKVNYWVKAQILQAFSSEVYGDPNMHRQRDISLAQAKLGWAPTTQLEVGLPRTIEYFARQLGGAVA